MNMKKQIPLLVLIVVIVFTFSNCKKSNNSSDPITCNLSKQTQVSEDMTVSFSAIQTGDGLVKTLTYKIGTAENVVTNPSLPWELSVAISANSQISIKAEGTTTNGSVEVAMKGSGVTSTIYASDYCSHQSK